jgi:hypothetical protein
MSVQSSATTTAGEALCDEAMQLCVDSIGIWPTNFNDSIPLRRIIACGNGPQLNQKQRCRCLQLLDQANIIVQFVLGLCEIAFN